MTAELKCSDGPWSVEGREIADAIGRRIAVVSGDPRNPRVVPVMQANAAMMGAARALYEALDRILHYHGASISQDCTSAAERAMAQARGKTS